MSRRSLVAMGAVVPALAAGAAKPSAQLASFMALSARLTGFEPQQLDAKFAADLLLALTGRGMDSALRDDVGDEPDDGATEWQADVIAAWYSGVLPSAEQPVVGTFHDALIWRAMPFANPPTVCDAAAGWSSPPSSAVPE